ncbi:MAG TPA: alpha-glucan family phosphorylase, partial [Bacteroidales bacterium]|nr:alpha-glucan family phosphorylase [Bacteroidales bacterium]
QPLYSKMDEYDGDAKAAEFHLTSKQSMEKICAANADAFTTVSDITAKECSRFLKKDVDVVTPNGLDADIIPSEKDFKPGRDRARETLLKVAGSLLGDTLPADTFIIASSGRYEFKNKGIDLYLDALGRVNTGKRQKRKILAFILVPASHYGPRKDLVEKMKDPAHDLTGDQYLTHNLHYADHDPVINRIKMAGLANSPDDKVDVIFVPSYLDGNDGIFNLNYYELLIGIDLTIFPSYYEPWGYTPLESLAFRIPSLTTSVSGFGMWVKENFKDTGNAIFILDRTDHNDSEVVDGIAAAITGMDSLSDAKLEETRHLTIAISRSALWPDMIEHYRDAWGIALEKVADRTDEFIETEHVEQLPEITYYPGQSPVWKKVIIQQNIPEKLKPLEEMSRNLWWSWNPDAIEMFSSIDAVLWEESAGNPIVLLEKLAYQRLSELEKDKDFIQRFEKVYAEFRHYINAAKRESPQVSYFSMEFGLHESLKIYSGGLGLLAGDYLKEASDYDYNIVGVGLLYRFGYFKQDLTATGEQIAVNEAQIFSKIPVTPVMDEQGNWKEITIVLPGRDLKARIWTVEVGRVKLYLLDTDFEENQEQDRSITHHLYGGDNENRFKQELLLGVGGIRALRALDLDPDIFHCNEGHAAFIGLERLREYIQEQNLTFPESLEIVRSSTLFTTHTPVPAGHDYFDEDMMRAYMAHYPNRMKITWEQMMNLGRMHLNQRGERFSMSCLAVNLSQEVNGVSEIHGKVSREMFADMWKGYMPEEVPIGYVTNGVHLPTWLSGKWRDLYKEHLDSHFCSKQDDREMWASIRNVDQTKIWKLRNAERKYLIDFVKAQLMKNSTRTNQNPKLIVEMQEKLDPNALTIGFARRFATYKRAHLLFRDPDRLASIINNPFMPVQLLFAGKAHPNDRAGQELIRKIVEYSSDSRFLGRVIFLENYEIPLAKRLLHGVDIWLNTPTRPLEASGTSGEKAVMNGGLHFSVLDGWWAEGYKPGAGWALEQEKFYENQDFQDQLDAETIYNMLENEIAPLFYKRDVRGVPVGWVNMIQKSISQVAPEFTMNRMLLDYINKYYSKLYRRSLKLRENEFNMAARIAHWKRRILSVWSQIEVVSVIYPDTNRQNITVGNTYTSEVVLDLKSLSPKEIGVEYITGDIDETGNYMKLVSTQEFELAKTEGSRAWYRLETIPTEPGIFDFGIRLYPKHELLAHPQEMGLVRWV